MQKNKILCVFLTIVVVFISLACELVNAMTNPGEMRIESVDVAPAAQAGKFTASVAMPFHSQDGDLNCYVRLANGKQKDVYRQTVPGSDKSSILTFDFEESEPGKHKLYCISLGNSISASTTFTVNAPPAAENGGDTPAGEGVQYPIKIKGSGTWRSHSNEYACSSSINSLLTINSDGSALLEASGDGFIDHINCTKSANLEAWAINGTADLTSETVTFTKCNSGGFKAGGTVRYQGGSLSGKVLCQWIKGDEAGKTAMDLSLP
jgi:hypothetical protein